MAFPKEPLFHLGNLGIGFSNLTFLFYLPLIFHLG